MPKYYADVAEEESKPKRSCDGLREDLKTCLVNSDCVQKHGKTPRECLLLSNVAGSPDAALVPSECQVLRQTFFECKRSILDMRTRFRGRKGYWSFRFGNGFYYEFSITMELTVISVENSDKYWLYRLWYIYWILWIAV